MNDKEIKANLKCWWTSDEDLHQRMRRQFFTAQDQENFILTGQDPDFTIVFGRVNWDTIKTPKDKTFYFSQEPLFSHNEPKDTIHDHCSKAFIADRSAYPERDEYIEQLMPMFYGGRGEFSPNPRWDWSYKIKDTNYEKDKLISNVVTNTYNSHCQSLDRCRVIYELRTKLSRELSKNKNIDIFGTHWEPNSRNIKGEVWNKHVALDEYIFSVGCENSIQKNYISEKFWDIILTEGIPIYLGCNNIEAHVPDDSYIPLNSDSIKESVSIIEDVMNNKDHFRKKYTPKILELKQEFFNNSNYNIWEKIKLEINNA